MNGHHRHPVLGRLPLLILAAAVASASIGCSSTASDRLGIGTTAPHSIADDSSVPTTERSSSSSSTTIPPVDPLVLRSDGVGTDDFGDDVATVFDHFESLLGSPASDLTDEYPVSADGGTHESTDGEYRYVAPVSRTVCWSNSLCLAFGGVSSAAMSFTGWRYDRDPTGSLSSASGATLGTSWADVPSMSISEGGCYTVGYGEVDGIHVVVQSTGLQFTEVDASGNYLTHTPAPADVTILSMETGELPVSRYADC